MMAVAALQAQQLRAHASLVRAQLANLDELRTAGELSGPDKDEAKELNAEFFECNTKFKQRAQPWPSHTSGPECFAHTCSTWSGPRWARGTSRRPSS